MSTLKIPFDSGRFERLLFDRLHQFHPAAYGHVFEIHRGKWASVHLYMPEKTPGREAADMRDRADAITAELLGESCEGSGGEAPICRSSVSPFGTDTAGRHFYSFWLPIGPHRTAEDFEAFFPKQTSNGGSS
jgi:hypothetical protein